MGTAPGILRRVVGEEGGWVNVVVINSACTFTHAFSRITDALIRNDECGWEGRVRSTLEKLGKKLHKPVKIKHIYTLATTRNKCVNTYICLPSSSLS